MGFEKKKADFTIRTQKFKVNKLLNRKQFIVHLNHPRWCGTVPLKLVRAKLAQLYKVPDEKTISLFGFKTKFGGDRTTGFGLIYDDLTSLKRIEPRFRKIRMGVQSKKKVTTRRSKKDKKSHAKLVHGKKKAAAGSKKKK